MLSRAVLKVYSDSQILPFHSLMFDVELVLHHTPCSKRSIDDSKDMFHHFHVDGRYCIHEFYLSKYFDLEFVVPFYMLERFYVPERLRFITTTHIHLNDITYKHALVVIN